MKNIYIYGLYDDISNEIRYVGKTINTIEHRLKQHIRELKQKKQNLNTHKLRWMNKVINNGGTINIKCLEIADEQTWEDKEKYWISYYENLTNLTEGGECGVTSSYTITYDECKKYIKENLKIKSITDWHKNECLIPKHIPKYPDVVYLNRGWISWGDFLGTGKIQDNILSKKYIAYEEAKEYIKNNFDIKTMIQWKSKVKNNEIPDFIPNRPERFYKKRGWISWGDFLNTGTIAQKYKKDIYLSYEDACELVRKYNFKSKKYFDNEKFENLPVNPSQFYKEWISWGDFLGTGNIQDNIRYSNYLTYDDAKIYILNNLSFIKTEKIWKDNVKNGNIPENIPNHPELYYNRKNRGWKGWKDFLIKKGEL